MTKDESKLSNVKVTLSIHFGVSVLSEKTACGTQNTVLCALVGLFHSTVTQQQYNYSFWPDTASCCFFCPDILSAVHC